MVQIKFLYTAVYADGEILVKELTLKDIERMTPKKIYEGFTEHKQPVILAKCRWTGLRDIHLRDAYEGQVVRVLSKAFVTDGFLGEIRITHDGVMVFGKVEDGKMSNDYGLLSSFEFEVVDSIFNFNNYEETKKIGDIEFADCATFSRGNRTPFFISQSAVDSLNESNKSSSPKIG